MTFPSPILISSSSSHSPLLSLQPSPSSLVIPLTPGLHSSTPPIFPPHGKDASVPGWLSPVSLTAHVDLVAEPDELLAFLKTSWASQRVRVGLKAEGADVRGVGRWLGKVGGAVEESVELDLDIPSESRLLFSTSSSLARRWPMDGTQPHPLASSDAQPRLSLSPPSFPLFSSHSSRRPVSAVALAVPSLTRCLVRVANKSLASRNCPVHRPAT